MKTNTAVHSKHRRSVIYIRSFLILCLLGISGFSYSQNNRIWQDTEASRISQAISERDNLPDAYRTVTLDENALKDELRNIPLESNGNVERSGSVFSLPMPDGGFQNFKIVESPIMEPELSAKFPEIKTYMGKGIDDPSRTVRFGWTSLGFHALILSTSDAVFIEPLSLNDKENYIIYHFKDLRYPENYKGCVNTESSVNPILQDHFDKNPGVLKTGDQLRTYRLAVAATGEYSAIFGGTVAGALAAIVANINQVDAIYEVEVAVRLVLVANNNLVIYTDATTDPYNIAGGNPCAIRFQIAADLDGVILPANYDIGHLFTGTNIGGCASFGCVCAANKSEGASGVTNSNAFDVGLVAHEMGHQFSAAHTFNSDLASCAIAAGQHDVTASYEPGSGTTIMSYQGSCGADDIINSRNVSLYFHTHSYSQIKAFTNSGGGNACPVNTATGNTPPTVNAGPGGYTIPISTPFILTGSGNDADGDALTFSWEQYDLGPAGSPGSPTGNAPLFRSFAAVSSPARTFPQLSDLLGNTQTIGEILPSYARTMSFRLIARDNRTGGGGVDFASTSVAVDGASGPFLVTAPNTAISWCSGTSQTVTWNVANTTAAPVSTANVNIKLSVDGGQTYPITLAANTPNDGSQMIVVPNNPVVNNARVKVEAVGNIFFDISNANFTIYGSPAFTSHPTSVNAEWGDNVSFSVAFSGTPTPSVKWQLSTDGGGIFNDIPSETNSTLNLTCVTLAMDNNQYRAAITNTCGTVYSDPATLTVVPRITVATITVLPNPQQYSDKVDFKIVITEANICSQFAATGADIYVGTQLMGTVVFVANGTSIEATLSNIALLEPVPFGTAPTGQMAPGFHNVTVVLSGVNPNFNLVSPTTILEILPEDARTYFTGACFASTAGVNSSAATVTLSATIRDITAETTDPAWDACPGDIRNATLTFINRGTNVIIAANVPIGLVDPNDPSTAVGTYDWNINIVGDAETFEIGIIIGGYYTRNHADDNVLITVAKPLSDFVTGGGYLVLQSPAGTVAGNVGSKNNFGFNVKFNKRGTNLQGSITSIIRKTEVDGLHLYKIKSNKLTSLAVQPSTVGGKATINAKVSIQDVTDPGNVISIAGNNSLQIKMSDWGNPGSNDSIAITIWDKFGGLWYASNWTGTKTAEQKLGGGNLNVASNNSFARTIIDEFAALNEISVYPNPNMGIFTVSFESDANGTYEIMLIDLLGRTVSTVTYSAHQGNNITEFQINDLTPGIYNLVLRNNSGINSTKRVIVK